MSEVVARIKINTPLETAGWGIRITFVSEGELTEEPAIKVREPQEDRE